MVMARAVYPHWHSTEITDYTTIVSAFILFPCDSASKHQVMKQIINWTDASMVDAAAVVSCGGGCSSRYKMDPSVVTKIFRYLQ